jgi:hypothetical protein
VLIIIIAGRQRNSQWRAIIILSSRQRSYQRNKKTKLTPSLPSTLPPQFYKSRQPPLLCSPTTAPSLPALPSGAAASSPPSPTTLLSATPLVDAPTARPAQIDGGQQFTGGFPHRHSSQAPPHLRRRKTRRRTAATMAVRLACSSMSLASIQRRPCGSVDHAGLRRARERGTAARCCTQPRGLRRPGGRAARPGDAAVQGIVGIGLKGSSFLDSLSVLASVKQLIRFCTRVHDLI